MTPIVGKKYILHHKNENTNLHLTLIKLVGNGDCIVRISGDDGLLEQDHRLSFRGVRNTFNSGEYIVMDSDNHFKEELFEI
jgi:hypothetical protein